MTKASRVLLIDGESSGEKMQRTLEEMFAEIDMQIHVVLAKTYEHVVKLLWKTRTRRGRERRKPRPSFDLGVMNLNCDWGFPGPLAPALMLQEQRKTPVLVYSPPHTGSKLLQLQDMVAGSFSGVFEMAGIPEAVQLHLKEPQKAQKFMILLGKVRSMGSEAMNAQRQLLELVKTMGIRTREACMCLLTQKEVAWSG